MTRKIATLAVGLVAAVTLGACGSSSPTAKPLVGTSEKPLAGSIINADTHLGPKGPCLGQNGVPTRVCDAWKKLTPEQRRVLSGTTYASGYPISVTFNGRDATVEYCRDEEGAGGQLGWIPAEGLFPASGVGTAHLLTTPAGLSCVPYLDPSGGGRSGEVIAVVVAVVVVVIAGVLVAVLRRKPRVRPGVLSASR